MTDYPHPITMNQTIAQQYFNLVKSQPADMLYADELIQLFLRTLKDAPDMDTQRIVAQLLGYLTMHPEVYPALVEAFQTGKSELIPKYQNSLNYFAGLSLLNFTDRLADTKTLFLQILRDSPEEFARFLAVNLLGTQFPGDAKELKLIFKKIIREDKSQQVRIQAWQRFTGLATEEEIKAEQEALKREITYSAIYEVLTNVQPGLQVPLARIIELVDEPYFAHAEEMRRFGIDMHKYSTEVYIEIIQENLTNKNIQGKYFEYEQVFVREGDAATPTMAPVAISKEYLCYYCGSEIEVEAKKCINCTEDVVTCNICKLPVSFGEDIGKCPHCEGDNHLVHLQEWVKVKSKCPKCMQKLTEEKIVQIKNSK